MICWQLHCLILLYLFTTGSRQAKASARGGNEEKKEEDDEEEDKEDESYNSESEEDIDLNADEDIEEDEVEEEEAAMPLKRAPRKAAQKANDTIEAVTESIASMAIAQSKKSMAASRMWSMDFVFPFMVKQFLHNARQSCTVDLLVPTIHDDKI